MSYDARVAAALSLFKREDCLSRFLTNSIGGSCRLFRSSSRWRLIAAISSGPQRAIGDAPTAAMEAVEAD
jgi:hypothetical protein